ncbi:hypothetical protein HMPREF0262_02507 [Clostridium sp. ATCC 29733]|nr:hypothetical protein HMPREF0262_02507 [Clostridium sp. ATCC 29733]
MCTICSYFFVFCPLIGQKTAKTGRFFSRVGILERGKGGQKKGEALPIEIW